MKFKPLVKEEVTASGGYTHRLDFDVTDIPAGIANNTTSTWNATTPSGAASGLPAYGSDGGTRVVKAHLHLSTPLKDASDAAFNSTTISIGDAGSSTRYASAVELNENGTEVIDTFYTTGATFTSASQFQFTLTSMAAKSLSNIDVGKFYFEIEIHPEGTDVAELGSGVGSGH